VFELTRSITVFDFETTCVNPKVDRVVQVAMFRLNVDGTEDEFRTVVNPECPIPPDATAVHGITDEMVINAPKFADIVPQIRIMLKDADLCGFNSSKFDEAVLVQELSVCGIRFDIAARKHVDAFELYKRVKRRTLSDFYEDMTGEKLEGAHDAMVDVKATLKGLYGLFKKYPHIPRNPEAIHNMLFGDYEDQVAGGSFAWVKGEVVFQFGKHNGKPLAVVAKSDRRYLEWICSQDFRPEVKKVCMDAMMGVLPKPKERS